MSLLDFVLETKTAQILKMVKRLTDWSFGTDKRFGKIERRLGAIEMAMEAKGFKLQPIDESDEENGG